MTLVATKPVEGYVWCTDPRCAGSLQREVTLIETETTFLYTDLGGDLPHPERSTIQYRPESEQDAVCVKCGGSTDCSVQKRPEYLTVVGEQHKLLQLRTGSEDRHQADIDTLKAEIEALRAQGSGPDMGAVMAELEALRAEVATKASKPGPKPKPEAA